jgi:hypothetical protein
MTRSTLPVAHRHRLIDLLRRMILKQRMLGGDEPQRAGAS